MNINKETKACSKVVLIYDCFRFSKECKRLLVICNSESSQEGNTNSNAENKKIKSVVDNQ